MDYKDYYNLFVSQGYDVAKAEEMAILEVQADQEEEYVPEWDGSNYPECDYVEDDVIGIM